MFIPPNYLELLYEFFEITGIYQAIPDNEKVNYRNHLSYEAHEEAYVISVKKFSDLIAPEHQDNFFNYFKNLRHFISLFNQGTYETKETLDNCLKAYWECLYAPLISNFLSHFRNINTSKYILEFFCDLLEIWEENQTKNERNLLYKDTIQKVSEEQVGYTPKYLKNIINQYRNNSIHTNKIINNNLEQLKIENPNLTTLQYNKIRGIYFASIIFKRLEKKLSPQYIKKIKENYKFILLKKRNKISSIHKKILKQLTTNLSPVYINPTNKIIQDLDNLISKRIKPVFPSFFDAFPADTYRLWPNLAQLYKLFDRVKFENHMMFCAGIRLTRSPLEQTIVDYYLMIYYLNYQKNNEAYELCLKIEESAKNIHIGEFESINMIHKISLSWKLSKKINHNKNDKAVNNYFKNLPLEEYFHTSKDEYFNKIIKGLDPHDFVILNAFRDFNYHYPENKVDPLKKISNLINSFIELIHYKKIKDSKTLHKRLKNQIERIEPIIPSIHGFNFLNIFKSIDSLYSFFYLPLDENLTILIKKDEYKQILLEVMTLDYYYET